MYGEILEYSCANRILREIFWVEWNKTTVHGGHQTILAACVWDCRFGVSTLWDRCRRCGYRGVFLCTPDIQRPTSLSCPWSAQECIVCGLLFHRAKVRTNKYRSNMDSLITDCWWSIQIRTPTPGLRLSGPLRQVPRIRSGDRCILCLAICISLLFTGTPTTSARFVSTQWISSRNTYKRPSEHWLSKTI